MSIEICSLVYMVKDVKLSGTGKIRGKRAFVEPAKLPVQQVAVKLVLGNCLKWKKKKKAALAMVRQGLLWFCPETAAILEKRLGGLFKTEKPLLWISSWHEFFFFYQRLHSNIKL